MKFSVEIILSILILVFLYLGISEFLQNNKKFNPRIKTRLRVAVIFFIVIIFNLLIVKS